jgi:hypothetical protein
MNVTALKRVVHWRLLKPLHPLLVDNLRIARKSRKIQVILRNRYVIYHLLLPPFLPLFSIQRYANQVHNQFPVYGVYCTFCFALSISASLIDRSQSLRVCPTKNILTPPFV